MFDCLCAAVNVFKKKKGLKGPFFLMVCFHPQNMYWTGNYTDNGKKQMVFAESWRKWSDAPLPEPIPVACQKCLGCRMNVARSNAIRIVDECSMFTNSCFITLTVGDKCMEEVFPGRCLTRKPFQDFAKRLRQRFEGFDYLPKPSFLKRSVRGWDDHPIRIVYCGEYGCLDWRPHFHAVLMNFDFQDKQQYSFSDNGSALYLSEALSDLWPYGRCDVGEVNFNSAAYLAGYVLKKQQQIEVWTDERYQVVEIEPEINGSYVYDLHFSSVPGVSAESYEVNYTIPAKRKVIDTAKKMVLRRDTGEILTKPFVQYPNYFGLGRLWYQKYGADDLYNTDFHVFAGKRYPVPRFYDKKTEELNPELMADVKARREIRAKEWHKTEEDLERMAAVYQYRQNRKDQQKKI